MATMRRSLREAARRLGVGTRREGGWGTGESQVWDASSAAGGMKHCWTKAGQYQEARNLFLATSADSWVGASSARATLARNPFNAPSSLPYWSCGSVRFASDKTGEEGEGSHSDFAPQYKAQDQTESVSKLIETEVSKHKVFVFMKGIPEAPQCGFSNMVCRILDAYDVEYGSRNVLEDMELRQGIKDYTQWPTIPQVFIDGEFVGGCDILMEMHKNGELNEMFPENK
ncbi:monothiol glutaredoxin [Chloropicon primus]|uniref:Monothiol glutaredoxin n=1 Tax=Chloropicon primus TaxID=1764295 RepID=A0A5B8MKN6_9CHLO|nr:monothiol glutaredoxin [Chloropicon primus]UPR00247.1 monothiol glutaredoxin [Chloropicon primus]|eukprot:QDZ21036.1 monothiol glutaredoxin [Chloropicon primus]